MLAAFTLIGLCLRPATAQDFRVESLPHLGDGRVRLQAGDSVGNYHILLRGSEVNSVSTPLAASLGREFTESTSAQVRFYRIQRVPLARSLDLDRDGLSDVFELQHPRILNPLNPADAALDSDDDGDSNLIEFQRGSDPESGGLTRLKSSSPRSGEGEVSVTRETILRFTRPLAPNTGLNEGLFFAEALGRRLLTRTELSSDRRTATLFYLEPVPANALVRVTLLGGGLRDSLNEAVDLDRDGEPGGDARIEFNTLGITPLPGTAVVGQVFASEPIPGTPGTTNFVNRPLEGVTIAVDGAEEFLRTTTDAQGFFKLSPCPPGRFFVHIDGRTAVGSAWPDGAYYPFVGKAWEAVAGVETNLAGADGVVYLPLIREGTLQPISATEPTVITFPAALLEANPALAGVSLTVPANGLYGENGVRGGRVGIAPVAPDRLPEKLPPGLELPIVITVQTDGPQNFDQPVPVRFPNLPDPRTGHRLPAGAKTGLWSFNHDTGRWELQGSMTISADGRFAESDSGVGIRQPGWSGALPTTEPEPAEEPADKCGTPNTDDLWNFLSTLSGCTVEVLRFGKLYTAATELPSFLSSAAGFSTTLYDSVLAGAPLPVLQAQVRALKEQKEVAVPIYDFFSSKEPIELGLSAAACASQVASALATPFCRPECGHGLCDGLNLFFDNLSFVAESLATIEGWIKDFPMTAFCLGIDQAAVLVGAGDTSVVPLGNSRFGARPAAISTEMALELRNLANKLRTNSASLIATGQALGDFYNTNVYSAYRTLERQLWPNGYRGGQYRLVAADASQVLAGGIPRAGRLQLPTLLANTEYELTVSIPERGAVGRVKFISGDAGSVTLVPAPTLDFLANTVDTTLLVDTDGDGLKDVQELLLGTSEVRADTDRDGVSDFAEVQNRTNPLNGYDQAPGLRGSANTPGVAQGVTVRGDLALVADGTAGVAVFDVSPDGAPIQIAQIDTPGTARSVAVEGNLAIVADGSAGVAVLDISNPSDPRRVRQVPLDGGRAGAIAVGLRDGVAYVAAGKSGLFIFEVSDGSMLATHTTLGRVDDIAVAAGLVHVLAEQKLWIFRNGILTPELVGSGDAVFGSPPGGSTPGNQFVACGNTGYVGHGQGFNLVDLSNAQAPGFLAGSSQAFATHAVAHDGSQTLALVRGTTEASRTVALFDTSIRTNADLFIAEFATPGEPRALAWHRGRLLVAAGSAGLQVVQPLPVDLAGVPPQFGSVLFAADADVLAPGIQVPRGARVRPVFTVTDDRQVARVDLLLNGQVVSSATTCPFEVDVIAAAPASSMPSAVLQLQAFDASGNRTLSAIQSIEFIAGRTGPQLLSSAPTENTQLPSPPAIRLLFDERSVDPLAAQLFYLGTDQSVGGGDDVEQTRWQPASELGGRIVVLRLLDVLSPGAYAVVHPAGTVRFTVVPPPSLVRWVGDADGNWSEASRWSSGRIPGPADYVVIDQPGQPTVTLDLNSTIAGIQATGRLILNDHSLTVAGTNGSIMGGTVTMRAAALIVRGGALTVPGLTRLESSSLIAREGARLSAPNCLEWRPIGILGGELKAEGARSELDLPGWTTATGPFGDYLFGGASELIVQADLGGQILAPQLGPIVTGEIALRATRNGTLFVPTLTTMSAGAGNPSLRSELSVSGGARLVIGPLVSVNGVTVQRGVGAELEFNQLATVTNSTFRVDDSTAEFSALMHARDFDISANTGARVTFPALREYEGRGIWSVAGGGARLSFPILTRLQGPTDDDRRDVFAARLSLTASTGGTLDLPALAGEVEGRVSLTVSGPNSSLVANGITRLIGNPTSPGRLDISGGTMELRALTRTRNVNRHYRGSGTLDAPGFNEMEGGAIVVEARITPNLDQYVRFTDVSLVVLSRGMINIPAALDYRLDGSITSEGRVTWSADEASGGGKITFALRENPIVDAGPATPRLAIRARFGGEIDLSRLASLPTAIFEVATPGTQGVIDLSGLREINGAGGTFELSPGASIGGRTFLGGTIRLHPEGVTARGVDFILQPISLLETSRLVLEAGARLSGAGEFPGSLDNRGEVAPGFANGSLGRLVIKGDYTQEGRLTMRALTQNDVLLFDQLHVDGAVALGGALTLAARDAKSGSQYPMITAGQLSGVFGTVAAEPIGTILTYSTDQVDVEIGGE